MPSQLLICCKPLIFHHIPWYSQLSNVHNIIPAYSINFHQSPFISIYVHLMPAAISIMLHLFPLICWGFTIFRQVHIQYCRFVVCWNSSIPKIAMFMRDISTIGSCFLLAFSLLLVGGIPTPLKNMSSSMGGMTF